jgi:hypothetical protein
MSTMPKLAVIATFFALSCALVACETADTAKAPCGGVDEACCVGVAPCSTDLGCSANVCLSLPFADGNACATATECASSICGGDGICAVPSCTDTVVNGDESDVDCGGSCGPCALGQGCKATADCIRGSCFQDKCGFEPGGLLGKGGDSSTVAWTQIAGAGEGLWAPADLAFNTDFPEQLWVVDRDHDALLVIFTPDKVPTFRLLLDISQHFLEEVLAISFDGHGSFGTCGDSRNDYGGQAKPNDFMGPVQWPSNIDHYPKGASAHTQHWDMLHSTPSCLGIIAAGANQFFCVNGQIGSIDWYDFHLPHVPGGDDHSDGEKRRYLNPSMKIARVEGLPSNMVFDAATGNYYIADTGNGRIVRFSPDGATKGKLIQSFGGDGKMHAMSDFAIEAIAAGEMTSPTGLALHEGTLYVGDNASGIVHAYSLAGVHLRALDSGLGKGRLGGMTAGPDDRLYFADITGKRVVRIDTTW